MLKNLITILSLSLVLSAATWAFAGSVPEYSADMVDVQSGKVVGRYYVAEKKMRMESFGERGEGSIAIIRMDQQKMYALQEDKTYLTVPLKGDKIPDFAELGSMVGGEAAPKVTQEKVGSETVNGFQTEKFRVTATIKVMGKTHTMTSFLWKAKEFDLPVRTQDEQSGLVVEMRNIREGAPAPSLFEVPAGYRDMSKEMEKMMEMMKSRQGKQ